MFYEFSLERNIPADHLLRSSDRFVDLEQVRQDLASLCISIGRPSINPELMIRMLLIGYCFGIRSERRLCDEGRLNSACRWFCRLGLDVAVPDHPTFPRTGMVASGMAICSVAKLGSTFGTASDADWSTDVNRTTGVATRLPYRLTFFQFCQIPPPPLPRLSSVSGRVWRSRLISEAPRTRVAE